MTGLPAFGVLLLRLLNHRQISTTALAQTSGIPEPELQRIIDGAPPTPAQLELLSPALDLRTPDLCVMANEPVPEELTPLDPSVNRLIVDLINDALCLPADQRAELLQTARDLPQRPRPAPFEPRAIRGEGFGAMLTRMLYNNRNIIWSTGAQVVALMTNGRMYVSATTIAGLGATVELTPARLAGIATVLGIAASDLAAITGIDSPESAPPDDPAADDAAKLLWEARRLTAGQLSHICAQAAAERRKIPDNTVKRAGFFSNPPS